MNAWQKLILRLVGGEKALYDLHPELRSRIPVWREFSDAGRALDDNPAAYYSAHVWVHKAVNIIAANIAPLELQVMRDGVAVDDHPVGELLREVNPVMSPSALWREWAVNMLLYGEHGLELTRNRRGVYAEIWPRPAPHYMVRVARDGKRYRQVVAYRIDDGSGEPYDLAPDEFIHFLFYNPVNPFRGLSPISAVREGIMLDVLSQAWARTFFNNAAVPLLAVIAPQGLTAAERSELEAKFAARYAGIEHAHGVIAVEDGVIDIKPISLPPRDVEWIEQRKLAREEIGAIFGVPDEMMGWGRDTYENFRQAMRAFWQLTLLPLVRLRDDHLTSFFRRVGALGPGEEVRTNLAAVEALQEDRSGLLQQAETLFGMGVPLRVIDDLLGLGIGELEGDHVGYLPLSLTPATRIPEEGGEPAPEPEPEPERGKRELKAWEFESAEHKATWLLFKARTEARERAWLRTAKKAFQAQQDRVAQAARSLRDLSTVTVADIFNAELEMQEWMAAFRPLQLDTVREAIAHGAEQINYTRQVVEAKGVDPDVILSRPDVQKAIEEMLWDFTYEVIEATQRALEALLRQALDEGWSIPRLSDGLSELFSGFKGARAERIARTEVIKAYNYGTQQAYREAGVERRRWIAALDERTRPTHIAAHGQIQPIDKPFDVGGSLLMFPGDPNGPPGEVVNCRCTIVPVFEWEV